MPSLGDILFLGFLYWPLRNGSRLLNDGDTGWHLVTGETILSTFGIPYADPYSHTVPGISWTAHEWLAEVILAASHRLMGLNGPVLISASIIALTFFFLYLFMLRGNVSPPVAVALTILAAWVSRLHWLARPHIFSLLLTLAFFVILNTYQRERRSYLKLLPVLMLVWVNLHGGYILGLILVLLCAIANLALFLTGSEGREALVRSKALGIAFVLTLLATFANPRGPAILLFPFHLVGREYIQDNVVEWMSPDFHKYTALAIMLLLYMAVLVLSRRKPGLFEGSAALLLTYMSLYSVRYAPLLAVLVTPMAAGRLGEVLAKLTDFMEGKRVLADIKAIAKQIAENLAHQETRFRHHFWVYAAAAVLMLIGLNGGRIGQIQVMDFRHDKDRFPVEALEFVQENSITGNMFNNDGWGGYLIYKAYPRYKVFMDGRSDMYDAPLLKEYVKVAKAQLGFDEVLEKYNVTWVIFNANTPLCQLLAQSGKWKLVYADATANVLVKNTPENRDLIEEYKDVAFVTGQADD